MTGLRVEKANGIALVTLARPAKLNALDADMMVSLADLWADLERDHDVRVVVVTGEGDRAFSSGADLASLAPLAAGSATPQTANEHRWVNAHQSIVDGALLRGVDFGKPIISAVNGLAVGAGFELVLASDIRIASHEAYFQLSEVKWGLIPSGGALARLPRQIGWAKAMEMVLAAEPVDAERALHIGLINRVVEKEKVLTLAMQWATKLCHFSPFALRHAKDVMVKSSGTDLSSAFAIESARQSFVLASGDAREGLLAFNERRSPEFTGI